MSQSRYDIPFYDIHVFSCINQRPADHPRGCCAGKGSVELQEYMKQKVKSLGLGSVRTNKSGCLDRCELGPVMVIYPQGAWYTYATEQDIDEIIDKHILGGERVERLALAVDQKPAKERSDDEFLLKVVNVEDLTTGIKKFELTSPDGIELPAFTAGSHIDVEAGDGEWRSYSLANSPAETGRYVIAVLNEPDGTGGSTWMHENVYAGGTVHVKNPLNNFPLSEEATEHLFIAGGIGITPILSMGHRLKEIGAKAHLHYCSKSKIDMAFREDVKDIFSDNVSFHHDGGNPAKGINLSEVLATPAAGCHVYVCGPLGLMGAVQEATRDWPEGSVHFEYFKSPDDDTADGKNTDVAFDIFLSRQGEAFHVPADKTILEVLRAANLSHPSSCEEGLCGTCSTRLVSGKADHRDNVLSDAQKAANKTIMVCKSRAMPGETLILDL